MTDHTRCTYSGLSEQYQDTIHCSGDSGHSGDHYFTGAQGENLCYWGADRVLRWVNR